MGFNAALGGYTGKLGKDIAGPSAAPVLHTATRFDALLAYVKGPARLGVEYFKSNNYTATISGNAANVTTTFGGDANGVSVFGNYKFTDTLGVFARYDEAKFNDPNPAITVGQSPKETYYTLGATYSPYRNVDFSLAYKSTKVSNGTISTVDGTMGSLAGTLQGNRNEVGLWGQFRF